MPALILLILLALAVLSFPVQASEPSTVITDQHAGYDQAKFDECMDSAEEDDCSEIVEAGL